MFICDEWFEALGEVCLSLILKNEKFDAELDLGVRCAANVTFFTFADSLIEGSLEVS